MFHFFFLYLFSMHPGGKSPYAEDNLYQKMAPQSSGISRHGTKENLSVSGKWHSLDSISQHHLAGQIKTHQKFFLRKPSVRDHSTRKETTDAR